LISFLIPFRSNDPHRKRSFKYIYEYLVREWPDDEVLVANNPDEDFRIARSRNMAASAATGDVLVFVDADTWTPRDQMQEAIDYVFRTEAWALPYDTYFSLTEEATEDFYSGQFQLEFEYAFPTRENPDPAVAGAVAVSRLAFETVHGYDDRYIGWGEEDRAFVYALETLAPQGVRICGAVYHLWHPAPEEARFGQPFFNHNRSLCNRYRSALGNPQEMGALVAEH
jgi:predicted glycosyltransferase involved in capsule biosynthesis